MANNVTEIDAFRKRVATEQHVDPSAPLNGNGGDGTSGGMTDDWKASVDRQLSQLDGDVRKLLYALIAAFLILAGGGWTVYDKLNEQVTSTKVEQIKAAGEAATRDATTNGKLDVLIARKGSK